MAHHASSAFVGGGLLFFADQAKCSIDRFEFSKAAAEALGRVDGHVRNVGQGDTDTMLTVHVSGFRIEPMLALFNKMAKSRASMTSTPAAVASTNIYNMQRITIGATTVAATLTAAGVCLGWEMYKRDWSRTYTKATDYTAVTSLITKMPAGSLTAGQEVFVAYHAPNTGVNGIPLGKGSGPLIAPLVLSFRDNADGYLWQYDCTKASPVGPASLVVARTGEWAGIDVQFRIIYDADNDAPYGRLLRSSAAVPWVL
jgi:hypothetical protein